MCFILQGSAARLVAPCNLVQLATYGDERASTFVPEAGRFSFVCNGKITSLFKSSETAEIQKIITVLSIRPTYGKMIKHETVIKAMNGTYERVADSYESIGVLVCKADVYKVDNCKVSREDFLLECALMWNDERFISDINLKLGSVEI